MKTIELEVSVTHLMRIEASVNESMFDKITDAFKRKNTPLHLWDKNNLDLIDFLDTHFEEEMANEVSYRIQRLREID